MNVFKTIKNLKKEGKVIGFTASTFDLMHSGHDIMLQEAACDCDFLIVGLLTDPTISRPDSKNKPVQSILERWFELQAVDGVDMVIPFDTEEDLADMIKILKPDLRFVGKEYEGQKHTGWDIKTTKIIYNDRSHNYGTSQLRKRIFDAENKKKK